MATITVTPDCGNSPKMALLKDFTIAFAEGNESYIMNALADTVRWEMVGQDVVNGKDAAGKMVKEMLDGSIKELAIQNIITHGDSGSVNGRMMFSDGTVFAFCDVYNFSGHGSNAKIQTITSFIMEPKK